MSKKPIVLQKSKLHFLPQFNPDSDEPARKMAIELLQQMIRAETVNPPGNETILAKPLEEWVKKQGFDVVKTTLVGSSQDRLNLIVDIPGSDSKNNPSWGFMSHIDVVPVEGTWEHPAFSGELIKAEHDSFIWGRGSMDTKSLGAAHLTAAFTALKKGWQPKGNIKILLCVDEEQGGHGGLDWLVEHHLDLVKSDCTLNEGGGFKLPIKNDFVIQIGEKGVFWTKLKIAGLGGHGSSPPDADVTAIYKMVRALENIKKYKRKMIMNKEFFDTIDKISIPSFAKSLLRNKTLLRILTALIDKLTSIKVGQILYPMVTDTIAATNFHSGIKENSISPEAEIILDIRTLPNHTREDVTQTLEKAIGKKLWKQMTWEPRDNQICTTSGIDNPYYTKIEAILAEIYPNSNVVPILSAGSTDCKFLRAKGLVSYGFSPMIKDEDISYNELMGMAHNINERISVTNLMLATDFAYRIMKQA